MRLNPFRSGQCLSTFFINLGFRKTYGSQSLSSRAMSFDLLLIQHLVLLLVRLNPFRSGQCLSTDDELDRYKASLSQSLSIRAMSFDAVRQVAGATTAVSQSLSNRAMSFDGLNLLRVVSH